MAETNFIEHLFSTYQTADRIVEALKNEIQSNPVDGRLNLQVFLNIIGRENEAFEQSTELLAIAPQDPRVLFNRGWHLIKRHQLYEGMKFLEYGRPLRAYGHPPLQSRMPLWTRQAGRSQRVHFCLEGGFGDEIIHVRFVKELVEKYDCKVTVVCQPPLADLLVAQDYVHAVAQREAALGVYHDSWIPAMSAALMLGHELKDLSGAAYLNPSRSANAKWEQRLSDFKGKLKVGIRWAGSPQFEHQQYRLFPSEILTEIPRHDSVQLFSFQRDNNMVSLPASVVDLSSEIKTWDDTAAALSQMDLVISSCTSVAHLAGALGRPTWIIVPALPYFIWAPPGETSPWYHSVRLFRQQTFGDWDSVRNSVHREFKTWTSASSEKKR